MSWEKIDHFSEELGPRFLPKPTTAVTKRRLYCMRLCARPRGCFFLSCFATFGVCPLTFPARASDPCTLPKTSNQKLTISVTIGMKREILQARVFTHGEVFVSALVSTEERKEAAGELSIQKREKP